MQQLSSSAELRQQCRSWKNQGRSLALVPTMGNIHAGHLSLVTQAQERAELTAVSVFVNPTQFNRQDDFDHYPRTLDDDLEKLSATGVDLVFTPNEKELYPFHSLRAQVDATEAAEGLESTHRPGHFRGVATVVCKLLNLFQPDIALFGKKDYQQLAVIRAMVEELFIPVAIIAADTVREADGLAMSSRNSRLTDKQRQAAPQLYSLLQSVAEKLSGAATISTLEQQAAEQLNRSGFVTDYFAIRTRDLALPTTTSKELVLLVAASLGDVRLIDNLEIKRH